MEDDDAVKAHTTNEHLLGEIQTSQTWKIGLQHPNKDHGLCQLL